MKQFNIYDYPYNNPLAKLVENTVNNGFSAKKDLATLKEIFEPARLHLFFLACILYWAETDRYDDRNKWAVFVSREIAKDFPQFKELEIPEELLREAFAFTMFAHRYLQNELFKVILEYFKQDDKEGIFHWFNDAEFVYDKTGTGVIRYSDFKQKYLL